MDATYANTLKEELEFTKNKLKTACKESIPILKQQIRQIKRDIQRINEFQKGAEPCQT